MVMDKNSDEVGFATEILKPYLVVNDLDYADLLGDNYQVQLELDSLECLGRYFALKYVMEDMLDTSYVPCQFMPFRARIFHENEAVHENPLLVIPFKLEGIFGEDLRCAHQRGRGRKMTGIKVKS